MKTMEEEEGLHPQQHTVIQLLRRREKTLTRTNRLLTAGLVLLTILTLLLLTAILLQRKPADTQAMMDRERNSSGSSVKQQQRETEDMYPSAMLTAPDGTYTDGKYLEWQHDLGNAHCQGGFNYSSGNLVVPRYGKYKVYLQITYESDSSKCSGHEMRLINKVFVFQQAYTKDRTLLSSVDTVSCSMEEWSKSLHTIGSFVLEANSILRVASSYPELIAKNEALTFFGAELQTVHASIT